jgi:hypothetical protein
MRRSLKVQIERDAKRVFLDLNDFAELVHIRYWRHGTSKEPEDKEISVVVEENMNDNRVWNRNKTHTKMGNDESLFQVDLTFFCARSDFDPPPRRKRQMEVDGKAYEVVGVTFEGGLMKVELRDLEE